MPHAQRNLLDNIFFTDTGEQGARGGGQGKVTTK